MRLRSLFIICFSLTFIVGLAGLIVFSNWTSDSTDDKPVARQETTDQVARELNQDTNATSFEANSANEYRTTSSSIEAYGPRQGTPKRSVSETSSQISDDEQTRETAAMPSALVASSLSSTGGDSAFAQPESSSTSRKQSVQGSTEFSSDSSTPDAADAPSLYPPRRIAWHQGLTPEQEWYRAWYGWAAFEAEESTAFQQSH